MDTPAPIRVDPKVLAERLAPVVCIVIHDVASPTWTACRSLLASLDAIAPAVRKTWLVVPRYRGQPVGSSLVRVLDRAAAAGDELALHGWRHQDDGRPQGLWDRLRRHGYTAGEGEFAALAAPEAAKRLAEGRAWFAQQGWPLHGFVPPAWLIDDTGLAEVERAGFDYGCTLAQLQVWSAPRAGHAGPRTMLQLPAQSVVYSSRAAWRRAASRAWNASVAWQQSTRWLLRIELHPGDAHHAGTRRSWMRILESALRTREPVTLFEAATRLREAHGGAHRASPWLDRAAHDRRRTSQCRASSRDGSGSAGPFAAPP